MWSYYTCMFSLASMELNYNSFPWARVQLNGLLSHCWAYTQFGLQLDTVHNVHRVHPSLVHTDRQFKHLYPSCGYEIRTTAAEGKLYPVHKVSLHRIKTLSLFLPSSSLQPALSLSLSLFLQLSNPEATSVSSHRNHTKAHPRSTVHQQSS